MSKILKAHLITVLLIVAGVFFVCAHAVTPVKAETKTTFEMLGMSIRYSDAAGDDGIRFGVKLDLATYNDLVKNDKARAGILVTPTDQISGSALRLSTATASKAQFGFLYKGGKDVNEWVVDGDYAIGIVYLHGLPEGSYNRPITAIAYIDWDNDGSRVIHSDTVNKSMAEVALAVKEDENGAYGTTAEQKTTLDGYLLNYDVEFLDENGDEVSETQSIKFGQTFTFPDDPDYLETRPFLGWQKRVGGTSSAVWSDDLIDVAGENLTVKKNVQYRAYFAQNVKYDTTIYNKENIKGGDPSVTYKDGYYYYCSEDSASRLYVLKSKSLEELLERGAAGVYGQKTASCVYTPKSGDQLGAELWAPELTYLRGKWYIYVCGVPYGKTRSNATMQMYVLECESQDPTGSYKAPVKVNPSDFNGKYTIDGHAFEYKGNLYYAFSGNNGSTDSKPQLYICTMSSPTAVNNNASRINKDSNTNKLKEGPCTIVDGDDLYLIYSAGSHDGSHYIDSTTYPDDYHLEYYKLTGSSVRSSSSWTAKGTCLSAGNGVYTVGHNHIFRNADGSIWTSYHGIVGVPGSNTATNLDNRQVFVQPITISNGNLNFGGVKTTVKINESAGLYYSYDEKQYLVDGVGSARIWKNNGNDFRVSATITRTTTTGNSDQDKWCAGITLYEKHGDGRLSKLLIGVEKEGNVFLSNYYSRSPYCFIYVGWGEEWSAENRSALKLEVVYEAGGSVSTSTITINTSSLSGNTTHTKTYTLAEINDLISDDIKNSDPLNKPFDLHFTGDFEIGFGGNRNRCSFTNVDYNIGKEVSVGWDDGWGSEWEPW